MDALNDRAVGERAELGAEDARCAEETLRRRLAAILHDSVMQDLSAVRQDLSEARGGDGAALERAISGVDEILGQLRGTIGDLFILGSRASGDLRSRVESMLLEAAGRGGFTTTLGLAVGRPREEHVLAAELLREWLRNAIAHAHADQVRVTLVDGDGHTVVELIDDGVGLSAERLEAALREGHIGIASSADRVEEAGGRLTIEPTPGGGTTVRAILPHAV